MPDSLGLEPYRAEHIPAREYPVHDLTQADYAFRPADHGQTGHITAFDGLHPREGDYLLLRNGNRSSRYRVTSVDHCPGVDPPTMWMASLEFSPRPAPAGGSDAR